MEEQLRLILSIIIPVYNVRNYIAKCLQSIASQNANDNLFEVIIVNDGTPDDSITIAEPFLQQIKNAVVINQENQGLSAARNVGLEKAKGEYVWFVDSDDWLLPGAVDQVLKTLYRNPGLDVISSPLLQVFETTGKETPDFIPTKQELSGKDYLKLFYLPGAIQRFIIRRQFIIDCQLQFWPKLLHEDGFFGLQMLYYAREVKILPKPVYAYRIRQTGSIMSSITMKSPQDLLFIHKRLRLFQKEKVSKLDQRWYQYRISFVLTDLYQFSKPIIDTEEFSAFYYDNWIYLHRESLIMLSKPSSFFIAIRMMFFPVLWIKLKKYACSHIFPPPLQVRKSARITNKIRRFVSKQFNNILLSFYGVERGADCCIHGRLGLRIAPKSKIMMGDNCYISSGIFMNPLCASDKGFLCVEKGAILIIGNNCAMSSPRIWARQEITIGNHVMLGGNVTIVDSDCHSLNHVHRRDNIVDNKNAKCAPVHIEDDVFVGMNVIILKGVTIGARSVIGAGSVLVTNIPADCIAAGNPAKVIKRLK